MAEKRCGVKAVARFNWAGTGDESYCCREHGADLAALCDEMGWTQVFVQLPDDTDKTCRTFLEESDED